MKLHEARKICKEVQAKLKLEHWTVIIRWGTQAEVKDLCGYVEWQTEYRKAQITLNRWLSEDAMRHTIIHEFIHLLLESHIPRQTKYDACYEFGINVLAGVIT